MRFLAKFTALQLSGLVLLATLLGFGLVYAVSTYTLGNKTVDNTSCDVTCVALNKDGASPNTIAVPVGSYVQFNSADGKSHNLSIGKGGDEHEHTGKFYSGEFQADEAWRVQFNDEGTFTFHDHLNPKINVVVVVYQPGKDYKIE